MLYLLCFGDDYCFGFVILVGFGIVLIIVVAWSKGVCFDLVFIWFSFVWLVGFNVVFGLMLMLVD